MKRPFMDFSQSPCFTTDITTLQGQNLPFFIAVLDWTVNKSHSLHSIVLQTPISQ